MPEAVICAWHLGRFLASRGDPDMVEPPAAVTVYNGEAMCRECFVGTLREERDNSHPNAIDTGVKWPLP